MEKMCGLFGKSRQAWYKNHRAREVKDMQNDVVLNEVKFLRKKTTPLWSSEITFSIKRNAQKTSNRNR